MKRFQYINQPNKFSNIHENLYNNFWFCFSALNAAILNIPGIKYNTKGIKRDANKLTKESFKRCICVFT